ncbi:MAG: transposase [Actinobacteria bacterium]|nr:transposase [Actinomycetota bacterium]
MPRGPRLDIPGVLQHVIFRGIERKEIFKDEKDYQQLLKQLSCLAGGEGVHIYAFTLMPNHAHMLVRPLNTSLSTFMRRLLTGYAVYFNRRHKRAGHLFQNRYKSFVVEEDKYFLELVRYIHLNPVRAGIISDVKALSLWPYSGYAALMGKRRYSWYDPDRTLSFFGKSRTEARRRLTEFMRDGIAQGKRSDLSGGGLKRSLAVLPRQEKSNLQAYDERILGDGAFVEAILAELDKQEKKNKSKISLNTLLERVASHYSITKAV